MHSNVSVQEASATSESRNSGSNGRVGLSKVPWASTRHEVRARFVAPSMELQPEKISPLDELLAREEDLPPATMCVEAEYEDWLDAMSRRLKEYILPVSTFVRLWMSVVTL